MGAIRLPNGALTVTAYARHRGVTRHAVEQRIAAGSLPTAVKKRKGRWIIVDAKRADAEWVANTRPYVTATPTKMNGATQTPLADAALRERTARASNMELEIARKTRELVPSREVDLRWAALVVGARTRMLGLPSRAKQRLPHLTGADIGVLEALIREALEELAGDPVAAAAAP